MPFATARDGARLFYDVIGAGPPVLLVAGQASDHTVWDGVRDDFAARHSVIVFDHRGTGDSDKPEAPPYSTRGFADDAVAILDHLGIARAHAYGISMGGRIGQWLGIDHAARLGALVLGCTTPGGSHAVRRPPEVDVELVSGDPARLLPFQVSPAWSARHADYLADRQGALRDRPVPPHARRLHYLASEAHDAWDLLPAITVPTLVLHGSDDQMNPTANAALLAARIPGAELHLVEGGRHAYFVEYRPAASQVVLAFLARNALAA